MSFHRHNSSLVCSLLEKCDLLVHLLYLVAFALLSACGKDNSSVSAPPSFSETEDFIAAADISSFPEIELSHLVFYDEDNRPADFLLLLKQRSVNTIRLRLWVNPPSTHSSLAEVSGFAKRLRQQGFGIWLSVHYSDTWADPQQQHPPKAWRGLPLSALKDSVRLYTQRVAAEVKPEFIQIGNEINHGFLHPVGDIRIQSQPFRELLMAGIQAVREVSPSSKIILHYAGIENAGWFYQQVAALDYDIAALSYYPIWHGKNLDALKNTLEQIHHTFGKKTLIAETAYPFTLGWSDWTTNIVGLEEQLLPGFPATPQGQQMFLQRIKTIAQETSGALGFCYWGGELVAWKGPQATDGSPWENQALFDFQHRALPVLSVFKGE